MSGLTMQKLYAMDFLKVAKLVNSESFSAQDRLAAANALHARAAKEMNGAGWLAMDLSDKAAINKAMAFDTTGGMAADSVN
jgi:hypothetical protein